MRTRITRLVGVFALVAIASALAATPAGAKNPESNGGGSGFVEDTFVYGFFYGDFESYVAMVGMPAEDFCLPGSGGEAPLRVFIDRDGVATLKVRAAKDQPIYVYEHDGGEAISFLDTVCPALFDDDPLTVAPEPFAIGSGQLKVTLGNLESPDDSTDIDIFNSINGIVTDADGQQWKLKASADLTLDGDGIPTGDPTEFVDWMLQPIRG